MSKSGNDNRIPCEIAAEDLDRVTGGGTYGEAGDFGPDPIPGDKLVRCGYWPEPYPCEECRLQNTPDCLDGWYNPEAGTPIVR